MRNDLVRHLVLRALQTYFTKREELCLSAEEIIDDVLARHGEAAEDEEAALFARGCVVGIARFEKLCEGAVEGYCVCLKRNTMDLVTLLWVAYLLYFCHDDLDVSSVRALVADVLPEGILDEYINYLCNKEQLVCFSLPLWKRVYDTAFIDRVVFQRLASISGQVLRGNHDRLDSSHPQASAASSGVSETVCVGEEGAVAGLPQRSIPRGPSPRARPTALPPSAVREMALTIPPPRPPPVRVPRRLSPIPTRRLLLRGVTVTKHTTPCGPTKHTQPRPAPATSPKTCDALSQESRPEPRKARQGKCEKQSPSSADAALGCCEKRLRGVPPLDLVNPALPVANTNASLLRAAHTMQRRTKDELQQRQEQQYSLIDFAEYDKRCAAARAARDQAREQQVLESHLDCLNTAARVSEQREQELKNRHAAVIAAKKREQREEHRLRQAQEAARQLQLVQAQRQRVALEQGRKAAEEQLANNRAQAVAAMKAEAVRLRQEAEAAEEARRTERAVLIQEIRLLRSRVQQQRRRQQCVPGADASGAASAAGSDTMDRSTRCGLAAEDGSCAQGELEDMSVDALRAALQEVRQREKEMEQQRRERICAARKQRQAARHALEVQLHVEQARRRAERAAALADKKAICSAASAEKEQKQAQHMLELHAALHAKREQRRQARVAQRKAEHERQNALLLRAEDKTAMERVHWLQLEEGIVHRVQMHQGMHDLQQSLVSEQTLAC